MIIESIPSTQSYEKFPFKVQGETANSKPHEREEKREVKTGTERREEGNRMNIFTQPKDEEK